MKNLILGYERGKNKWWELKRSLELAGQTADVITSNFENITGKYDRIWSMAESLLPVQAELEEKIGLNNVSKKAAEILTNKKKLDDFCLQNGLEDITPYSIIPVKEADLDAFENMPFIIKPVIGSGSKQDYDKDISYFSYKNKKDFMKRIPANLLFYTNQKGFTDPAFNNVTNYYMAQEHLFHHTVYAPYWYVNEHGKLHHIFTMHGSQVLRDVDDLTFESKPTNWWCISEEQVPEVVRKRYWYFYNMLVEELQLKCMFFAGPDFFYDGKYDVKYIDCNPRIGQGLQIMNEFNNGDLLKRIICNEPFEVKTLFCWTLPKLTPGKIKEVKDLEWLRPYLTKTSRLPQPNEIIPEYGYEVLDIKNYVKIAFQISEKDLSSMKETYWTINKRLQSCITYY